MAAVYEADMAHYLEAEVLAPADWTLLNFILEPRTGLNLHLLFAISNDQLMRDMMAYCRRHAISEILDLPDVREHSQFFWLQEVSAEKQIRAMPPSPGAW